MSKNIPIASIKQASNDKVLKLIYENTLAGIDDKKPLLTPKEKDALVEEASKRGLYKAIKLHYDLATAVRLLRVDLDNCNWRNRYLTEVISKTVKEWLEVGSIFSIKWLKPQNDSQKEYRDKIIKELTFEGKKRTPDDWLKNEWEFTVIKFKQYILEIREIEKMFNYQVVSDNTKEYLENSRFMFYGTTTMLSEDLYELLYDYRASKEFRAWLNKQGIWKDNIKKAIKIIRKHEPKEPLLTNEEKAMKLKEFEGSKGIGNVTKYISKYPIEEVGLSEKDLIPVKEFVDLIKDKYGINE